MEASPRPDRRVARSRRRLKQALLELLHTESYEDITVQDIADRADVGRSTFYAHFESKEDLLFDGLDAHLMQLTDRIPQGVSPEQDAVRFRFSLAMLRHVMDQRAFFEATIVGASDSRIRDVSAGILTDMVRVELERLHPEEDWLPDLPPGFDADQLRSARARAVVGAFMALVAWWLRSADHLSAEAVDQVFQEFARGGRLST